MFCVVQIKCVICTSSNNQLLMSRPNKLKANANIQWHLNRQQTVYNNITIDCTTVLLWVTAFEHFLIATKNVFWNKADFILKYLSKKEPLSN